MSVPEVRNRATITGAIDDNARRSIKVENLYLLDAIVNEMNH